MGVIMVKVGMTTAKWWCQRQKMGVITGGKNRGTNGKNGGDNGKNASDNGASGISRLLGAEKLQSALGAADNRRYAASMDGPRRCLS